MGHSPQLSGLLNLAVAGASQLPDPQQDRIALEILTMMAGEPETPPGNRAIYAIIDFIKSIFPVNDVARMVTIVLSAFILFVWAPATLLSGIFPIARELKTQPCPAPPPVEARPQNVEEEPEEGREVERLRQGLKQARERAERSERKQQLVERYYSVLESGIFEERTAIDLRRDPSGYSSVVAKIDRAISQGPVEVSSELRNLLLILKKFAADQYAVCDLADYHEVKMKVLKVMRQAIEAETNS